MRHQLFMNSSKKSRKINTCTVKVVKSGQCSRHIGKQTWGDGLVEIWQVMLTFALLTWTGNPTLPERIIVVSRP